MTFAQEILQESNSNNQDSAQDHAPLHELPQHPVYDHIFQSSNSTPLTQFDFESIGSLMLLIGFDDLIIASPYANGGIYVVHLRETKTVGASDKPQFSQLITPVLDFQIRQISVNATGTLLCVRGDQDVAVVVLPKLRSFSSSYSTSIADSSSHAHAPRLVTCSASLLTLPPRTTLAHSTFHPLSQTASHISVLSSTGTLWTFDVAQRLTPIHAIEFTLSSSTSFAADAEEREFTKFVLGPDAEGWDKFAVYALTKSGDIYSSLVLCDGFVTSHAHLLSLLHLPYTDSFDIASTLLNWGEFVDKPSHFPASSGLGASGIKRDSKERYLRLNVPLSLNIQVQGPYCVFPVGSIAPTSDIILLPPTPTQPLLLVLSHTDSKLSICLPGPARPTLDTTEDPELVVVEVVDLCLPGTSSNSDKEQKEAIDYMLTLHLDPRGRVLVGHDMGVHLIEVGEFLDEEEETGDTSYMEGEKKERRKTVVRELVRSIIDGEEYSNPPISLLTTSPPYASHLILFPTTFLALPAHTLHRPAQQKLNPSLPTLYPYSEYALPSWVSEWTPPRLTKNALHGVDESSLRLVASLVEQLRNASVNFESIARELQDRISIHKSALTEISSSVTQSVNHFHSQILPNHTKTMDNLSKIRKKQEVLSKRADTLVQMLLDGLRREELDREEGDWVKDVVKVARDVKGLKGRVERIQNEAKTIQSAYKSMVSLSEASSSKSRLSGVKGLESQLSELTIEPSQEETLREMLATEDDLIDELHGKFDELQGHLQRISHT